MAVTFGYGKKKFIQGLARLACRIVKYLVRYRPKLVVNLASKPDALACIDSVIVCLNVLCALLNKSDA